MTTKRSILKMGALALAMGATFILGPLGTAGAADPGLTVFDWAGYEDQNFYKAYVESEGDAPTFAFYADEEEAFQKLRSGFKADIAHPCSQSVTKWMEAGLLEPLDTSRIKNWDKLNRDFRDIEAYQKDGKYYFLPVEWGNTALTYRTDMLSEDDVASLQAFADPKFKGKVSIGDNVDDAYALAFLAVGVTDWSKATDEDFQKASDFLRKVHQNVRTYWADGASLRQLIQSGEVPLSWAWNETMVALKGQGVDVALKRDTKEGASSWVCGYVKLKDGPGSDDKVYAFLNAWMEPSSVDYMVNTWGYGHSNAEAMAKLDQAPVKAAGLDSTEALRRNTLWQGPVPVEMREKMIAEFERIKAGF